MPGLASNQVDMFGKEMLEEDMSFLYEYKGYIPVHVLGQIDDIIGVTLAGYKSVQMNRFLNVKAADKYYQFGEDKCMAMLVGKKTKSCLTPNLEVDIWETEHDSNGEFIETYIGKKPMKNKSQLIYLGVELSADGKNMNTIVKKRNKQIGKKKTDN